MMAKRKKKEPPRMKRETFDRLPTAREQSRFLRRMTPSEIKELRMALRLSQSEFAERIDVDDRRTVKDFETGRARPDSATYEKMIQLLKKYLGRSARLRRLNELIHNRPSDYFDTV